MSFVSQGTAGDNSISNSQESILNISDGDMKSFLQALQAKEDFLKQCLADHKSRSQIEGDRIQDAYSELCARQRGFDTGKDDR